MKIESKADNEKVLYTCESDHQEATVLTIDY